MHFTWAFTTTDDINIEQSYRAYPTSGEILSISNIVQIHKLCIIYRFLAVCGQVVFVFIFKLLFCFYFFVVFCFYLFFCCFLFFPSFCCTVTQQNLDTTLEILHSNPNFADKLQLLILTYGLCLTCAYHYTYNVIWKIRNVLILIEDTDMLENNKADNNFIATAVGVADKYSMQVRTILNLFFLDLHHFLLLPSTIQFEQFQCLLSLPFLR